MTKKIKLTTPLKTKDVKNLQVGDQVELSGKIYTARDSAHKRILNNQLDFDLDGAVIYHCGPLMKKNDGWSVVAAGPTTSTRLSKFIPKLLKKHNVRAMIGKGGLNNQAIESLKEHNSVYLAFPGGCAALAADYIEEVIDVKWLDLGMPEAVWKLKIKDFPTTVAIDTKGNKLYKQNKK
ncbi:Tartrate dehydratase beta subunit/Fumarate hydratase class I C-terminal domain FumA [Methanonatronarchaeum thermophilum]|uniref:Tartrate dehydratase beta subunit/Fumarate hydratase class I C-terminal domain FumA n=1 Tax=Methanonatronarchaeum thermophilum TaxID=1927129 RepID=A0A1Y3GCX5_9EURY|nr:FumA C-terminus/TtdB family hydratase beta subunit [Methanonatronarchaeum thermophilum]OUJ19312.1 Tartrate dehydratase beta subunit/Fumarate hydratase class I C-terminal domain FumA [Methanonatronarchaeum thermophilum]